MMNDVVIEVKEVYKSFRHESILQGVSLNFIRGKLTYILGSSGAGKSVLLRHILGLLKPDSGTITVEGQELNQLSSAELTHLRLKFGMLFQNAALFDDMTVYENVAFPLFEHSTYSDSEIEVKVRKTLALLGMKEGLDKFPNELSGGMKKRVGLARAIIREPSVLLYDEPTTGLDPVTRKTVDELIAQLKSELRLTSIVISHDLSSALLLADQIAFLNKGKIVFYGTPEEFQNSSVEEIQQFLNSERRALSVMM